MTTQHTRASAALLNDALCRAEKECEAMTEPISPERVAEIRQIVQRGYISGMSATNWDALRDLLAAYDERGSWVIKEEPKTLRPAKWITADGILNDAAYKRWLAGLAMQAHIQADHRVQTHKAAAWSVEYADDLRAAVKKQESLE